MSRILSPGQVQRYHDQGYVVVPALYGDAELAAMTEALMEAVRRDHGEPQPASRYVLMTDVVEEPSLAAQASDPRIVEAVEMLLGGAAALATFVAYLKTPGAAGTGGDYSGSHPEAHQDYKPYHNAGSSLNWLFAIMSMVDLDEETGPLYVAPGSHKLSRVIETGGRVRRVQRAGADTMAPLMDAGLRRGDLLLMNMFTWHAGGANRSDRNRLGVYNKYRARNAPPGGGPIVFSDAAHRAVVCRGRSLIPHHGNRPVSKLRLVVEREGKFLLLRHTDTWKLPGAGAGAGSEPLDRSGRDGAWQPLPRVAVGELHRRLRRSRSAVPGVRLFVARRRRGHNRRRGMVHARRDPGSGFARPAVGRLRGRCRCAVGRPLVSAWHRPVQGAGPARRRRRYGVTATVRPSAAER